MDEPRVTDGNDEPSNKPARHWWNSPLGVAATVVVWLAATYAKARIYTDNAWEAIGIIVFAYSAIGALTWAWIYGGKLREREEQRGRHDPPSA